ARPSPASVSAYICVFGGPGVPRMPLPRDLFDDGVAVRPRGPRALATAMGAHVETFTREIGRFNLLAGTGVDYDFHRGDSAYDRYYGDPTSVPNPNESPRVWWRL